MADLLFDPLFGIAISIGFFSIGMMLKNRLKTNLMNPLLFTIVVIILILLIFDIPFETYDQGGKMINLFLGPATAALAYSIYLRIKLLKIYSIPIIIGCTAGSLASMGSVYAFCRLFNLDGVLTATLIPKSVTAPIAIEISTQLGGIPSVTVAIVIITGIIGAILAPYLIRFLGISDPVAAGIAIGCSSHGIGTAKAIEIGDIEGAMSGIAIGVSGLITAVLIMIF